MIVRTKLKNNSTSGSGGIPSKLIKGLKFVIPLAYLATMSVQKGIFPEIWKQCDVIPMLKKGSKLEINNYMPIILMNALGNVIESAVVGNVMSFIDTNLPDVMHGFSEKMSAVTALCSLLGETKAKKARKNKVEILTLDCSVAFDTLNHQLILSLLKHMAAEPLKLG